MIEEVSVLQLSDIHLKNDEIDYYNNFLRDKLIKDLIKINDEKKIDIIIFSGDLIDQGGKRFNRIIVDPLVNTLRLDNKNIFFSPGNHDIDRNADSEIIEEGLKNCLDTEDAVNNFIATHNYINNEGIKRCIAFKDFEKQYYHNNQIDCQQTIFDSVYKLKIRKNNVGIACINTTWRCFTTGDKGKLIIGKNQIMHSLKYIQDCDYKILVSHHSTDFITEFERKLIDDLITEEFNLALHGHNHSPASWCKTILRGTLVTCVGRENWVGNVNIKDVSYLNGYSYIDLGINKVKIHTRVFSTNRNEYVKDTLYSGDTGYIEYAINGNNKSICFLHDIAKNIYDNFIAQIDSDLITNGVETFAPNDVNTIFVEPIITHWNKDENENEKLISIDEIIRSEDSYVLFGVKETGKTILLDKIIIEILENLNELNTIPIHIDYNSYIHSRIETGISHFTGVNITEIEKFIKENKIVLIIDNINFDENEKKRLKKYLDFIEKYPKVKIICTSIQISEGQIPLNFFDNILFSKLHILNIKYFKSKQIRELTEKWFSKIDLPNKKEKIEKIINLLKVFELPRTPLSISMFLWILETQEDYQPINQAVMLENFIEKMFKKHSKTEVYFSDFDYKNKEYLLSNIALEMYKKENKNYALSYTFLIEFIVNYFQKRKFEFNAIKILEHFVEVGLLVQFDLNSETFVRFRFNCFFQYFLMKNMEKSDFLNFVLNEERYLSFYDEIDYYTGLKRDKIEILKLLVERMTNMFAGISDDISKLSEDFDIFFDTKSTISEQLDRGFIEIIKEEKKDIVNNIDDIRDKILETIKTNNDIEKKSKKISPFRQLELIWTLSAKVLRNTEETEEGNLKYDSFCMILKSSLIFLCIYKILLITNIKKRQNTINENKKDETEIFIRFLPIIHESLLFDTLSSAKLDVVFKEHIDEIINKTTVSDLEKLVTVFLFADGKGKNYIKYLKKLLNGVNKKYTYDMLFFKILSYYYLRSDSIDKDNEYENMLADIIMLSRDIPKKNKSKIIQFYKSKRKKYESEKQLKLEL